LTLIGGTTLSVAAASISISAIPSTYAALRIVAGLRSTRASTSDRPGWSFNGDTTAAHYITDLALNNGGSAAFQQTATAAGVDSDGPGASFTAGGFSLFDLSVIGYHTTACFTALQGTETWASAAGAVQYTIGGVWLVTTVVSSIAVAPAVGPNWLAGSFMFVYGLAAS
jgi:hypothetical protein